MKKFLRESLFLLSILGWPILMLSQGGGRASLDELAKGEFWIALGEILLITIGAVGVIAGSCYGYYRFCRWFNRAIEAERSRVVERVAGLAGPSAEPIPVPGRDG